MKKVKDYAIELEVGEFPDFDRQLKKAVAAVTHQWRKDAEVPQDDRYWYSMSFCHFCTALEHMGYGDMEINPTINMNIREVNDLALVSAVSSLYELMLKSNAGECKDEIQTLLQRVVNLVDLLFSNPAFKHCARGFDNVYCIGELQSQLDTQLEIVSKEIEDIKKLASANGTEGAITYSQISRVYLTWLTETNKLIPDLGLIITPTNYRLQCNYSIYLHEDELRVELYVEHRFGKKIVKLF